MIHPEVFSANGLAIKKLCNLCFDFLRSLPTLRFGCTQLLHFPWRLSALPQLSPPLLARQGGGLRAEVAVTPTAPHPSRFKIVLVLR